MHRCFWTLIAAALMPLALTAAVHAQIEVQWVNAIDGAWSDSASWSTAIVPQNGTPLPGDTYHVRLNTVGGTYQIHSNQDVTVDLVSIDSPEATLLIDGGRFETDAFHVNQGQLVLQNGVVADSRFKGPGEVFTLRGDTGDDLTLENVTLATVMRGQVDGSSYRVLLPTDITFDDGILELGAGIDLRTVGDVGFLGNGMIVTTPDFSSCCVADGQIYLDGDSPNVQVGPGMTVRAEQGGWLKIDDWHEATGTVSLTNYGVIEVVGVDSRLAIDQYTGFDNEGTLRDRRRATGDQQFSRR